MDKSVVEYEQAPEEGDNLSLQPKGEGRAPSQQGRVEGRSPGGEQGHGQEGRETAQALTAAWPIPSPSKCGPASTGPGLVDKAPQGVPGTCGV